MCFPLCFTVQNTLEPQKVRERESESDFIEESESSGGKKKKHYPWRVWKAYISQMRFLLRGFNFDLVHRAEKDLLQASCRWRRAHSEALSAGLAGLTLTPPLSPQNYRFQQPWSGALENRGSLQKMTAGPSRCLSSSLG